MSIRRLLGLVLLWCWATASGAAADKPKPFVAGSMQEVVTSHAGQPFVFALWSLTCVHCKANLDMFNRLRARHPELSLVLVSTDTTDDAAAIDATLKRHGLANVPSWVFSDTIVERLRFEIDRRWRGELPRTYFYDAGHPVRAVSGKLEEAEIERWLQSLPGARQKEHSN